MNEDWKPQTREREFYLRAAQRADRDVWAVRAKSLAAMCMFLGIFYLLMKYGGDL